MTGRRAILEPRERGSHAASIEEIGAALNLAVSLLL